MDKQAMTTPDYDDILDALYRHAREIKGEEERPLKKRACRFAEISSKDARLLRQAADIVRERREYVNALQKARDDLTRLIDGAE